MTAEQKHWLDKNTEYRPVGRPGGASYWTRRGVLSPEGVLTPTNRVIALSMVGEGSIMVGVLVNRIPGQPWPV